MRVRSVAAPLGTFDSGTGGLSVLRALRAEPSHETSSTSPTEATRHVLLRKAQAVTENIVAATPADLSPRDALFAGGKAYLSAMGASGRTRLLLIAVPASALSGLLSAAFDRAAVEINTGVAPDKVRAAMHWRLKKCWCDAQAALLHPIGFQFFYTVRLNWTDQIAFLFVHRRPVRPLESACSESPL